MQLSLRIPLTVTVVVFMAGLVVFLSRTVRGVPLPTNYFIIWIAVSLVLVALTVGSWLRTRKR